MSQFALLLVTDEDTIRQACRGWVPPVDKPVTKKLKNPFTGEPVEVTSYTPPNIESLDCASLDEVRGQLRNAKPVSIDFKYFREIQEAIGSASPFLIGYGELEDGVGSPFFIHRVPPEREAIIVDFFKNELSELTDEAARRRGNLGMYVFVYDY